MQYLKLLRPSHWAKNLFLYIPLFFAGEIFDYAKVVEVLLGFFAFSLIASSIYIINDYNDVEADRRHPVKCKRPIASGAVSKPMALVFFVLCLLIGGLLAWYVKPKFLFVTGIYFIINLLYSFGLKNISILDILILSIGFVLRVKAGGVAANVAVSEWLMIMVFLLALFMAVAKRRDDVLIKTSTGQEMRKAAAGYNLDFMNVMLALVSAVIIVAYLMYTMAPETMIRFKTYRLYYTCLFVIGGLLRYLQITYVENNTGSPTKILYKDRFIQLTILLWVLSFYVLIYLPTNKSFFE
ncbi:MAG: UbiA prenyltransferase [Bacteroidetes bacterium]|uniref:decaprenyl-phosphate phosphoribosyltransferase n=1 Tax=unclassified Chitinophaga TaxID=2619133 RepID=UPI0009CC5FD0|nr:MULTISPECIES: decaprenyl-phosphate phosphoribosyltransferase [unclassified Chitinophaga]MBP1651932.1 UbiA prenyltransferase [Bacteroidota bacterium]OMP78740.1 decaprenyl-phosphate phosphoribosyltransferase [[Flexibacter] sp. ATCC 35208]WPV64985.1 decaprenyl-phosphate phosphoribosyltransferase [Chitinophaga sp. LS1]